MVQRLAVIAVAAGTGSRAGGARPKQLWRLADGRRVIDHALAPFLAREDVAEIVIVAGEPVRTDLQSEPVETDRRLLVVDGGATRQASVLNGLRALAGNDEITHVLIHDAARPLLRHDDLQRLIDAATGMHAATLAVPVTDTLVRDDDGTPSPVARERLWSVQTPQMLPFPMALDLHETAAKNGQSFTDDTTLAAAFGVDVRFVPGHADNIKITFADDLERANQLLATMNSNTATYGIPDIRVGHGYDVHVLQDGDYVTLGGVDIPHDRALAGHSDADVGLHALTDALLATIADGDIGSHFPPSDPKWRGASSDRFLAHAVERVRAQGGFITHCDLTFLCELPKIGPHRDRIRARVAELVGIDISRVSVKATTHERIGAIGRMEGISAIATATVGFSGSPVRQ